MEQHFTPAGRNGMGRTAFGQTSQKLTKACGRLNLLHNISRNRGVFNRTQVPTGPFQGNV